jgi:hypothetical protein
LRPLATRRHGWRRYGVGDLRVATVWLFGYDIGRTNGMRRCARKREEEESRGESVGRPELT